MISCKLVACKLTDENQCKMTVCMPRLLYGAEKAARTPYTYPNRSLNEMIFAPEFLQELCFVALSKPVLCKVCGQLQ